MNQHVSGLVPQQKRVDVWTPWGVQKVSDLDRVLDRTDPGKARKLKAQRRREREESQRAKP